MKTTALPSLQLRMSWLSPEKSSW